jgi:hypothetical protein
MPWQAAGSVLRLLQLYKLLARHGKIGSMPSRAEPVAVRRPWKMDSCFHSSTVFRIRRDTFENLFAMPTVTCCAHEVAAYAAAG